MSGIHSSTNPGLYRTGAMSSRRHSAVSKPQPKPLPKLRSPTTHHDFTIAIICALTLEADAVKALFDHHWDDGDNSYGRNISDPNAYSYGAVGRHNVVLVHMPGMGKANAAAAAASCRASFPNIKLAMVVGICGVVPFISNGVEVLLGDIIISDGLIQYDLGRRLPERFVRKNMLLDSLGRPNPEISSLLSKLKGIRDRESLESKIAEYLAVLRTEPGLRVEYPGKLHDRLFEATYCHIEEGVTCDECGCDGRLVLRHRHIYHAQRPVVHFGLIASGDTVMKSGIERDAVAKQENVVAFEMEGAGVWDIFPCIVIKSACDYADSHKTKAWQRYAAATAAACMKAFLSYWVYSESRNDTPIEEPMQAKAPSILSRLYPFRAKYEQQKDRNPERVVGTCEWFVNHELFRHWEKKKESSFLWVSADPGCGKSVLVKYLVDEVLPSTFTRTTCYFFFKDDFEDQKQITSALCCILYQLFSQKPSLLTADVLAEFEEGGEEIFTNFQDLWNILVKSANSNQAGEIVCVLDALDECEEKGQSELAKALGKFYNTRSSNSCLKVILISRSYARIQWKFQTLEDRDPTIHLNGENEKEVEAISREIDIVIQARIDKLGIMIGLSAGEKKIWRQELLTINHRTYLWVYLVFDLIEDDTAILTRDNIRQYIRNLPKTVEAAYDKILRKSPYVDRAKKLLHIVVAAARPLYLQEMAVALAITGDHQSRTQLGNELLPLNRLRSSIREACGLFVVIQDSRVYLLHQTAREFLIQPSSLQSLSNLQSSLKWQHSLRPRESHKVLSEICIWYLLLDDFQESTHNTRPKKAHDQYDLLEYSAENWALHFRQAQTETLQNTMPLALKLCNTESRICSIWFKIYWSTLPSKIPKGFSSLMIASYFGLENMVELLLNSKHTNLSSHDNTYKRSALSWASGNGHYAVVKLLIKRVPKYMIVLRDWSSKISTIVNEKDASHRSPLWYAAAQGHLLIVNMLIDKGANVNCKDDYGLSPLTWAIYGRHHAVASILIEKGAKNNFDAQNELGSRLLMRAVSEGNDNIVQMLLDQGANIEARGDSGLTPLTIAIREKHDVIAQILLDKGANMEAISTGGMTPLHIATLEGNTTLVQMLLDKGANIEAVDSIRKTALHLAINNIDITLIQILFNKGANMEAMDSFKRTALHLAINNMYITLVQMLLDKGANMEAVDNFKRTALHLGIDKRDITIIQMLLDKGANMEAVDKVGSTVLHCAIEKIDITLIQILLNKGANIEAVDGAGKTALYLAIKERYITLVQLLLDNGANVEAVDRAGKTALHLAIKEKYITLVQLLLDNGANIEAVDIVGRTPLAVAASEGLRNVSDLLLNRGSNRSYYTS